jgi:RNA polymerase sigma-70 factor (ECF subfamily)
MEVDTQTALHLLKRVATGDQQAFETLHRALARTIFAFSINQLRDSQRAEDVVVDTMHEVWKHPQRFDGSSKLSTWVLGIARNKILTALRERAHAHEDLSDDVMETVADDACSPFESLAIDQREHGVRECMNRLSDEHRECMHLVFYEGYSLREVAQLQDCPENTVKTRLFHARKRIQNCLRLLLQREGNAEGVLHA